MNFVQSFWERVNEPIFVLIFGVGIVTLLGLMGLGIHRIVSWLFDKVDAEDA